MQESASLSPKNTATDPAMASVPLRREVYRPHIRPRVSPRLTGSLWACCSSHSASPGMSPRSGIRRAEAQAGCRRPTFSRGLSETGPLGGNAGPAATRTCRGSLGGHGQAALHTQEPGRPELTPSRLLPSGLLNARLSGVTPPAMPGTHRWGGRIDTAHHRCRGAGGGRVPQRRGEGTGKEWGGSRALRRKRRGLRTPAVTFITARVAPCP